MTHRIFITCLFAIAIQPYAYAEFQSVRIQIVDVGQGDGILIRTPNEKWILIDAGTNKQIANALPSWGVDRLALAVVSHRHFDHHGGMDDALKAVPVDRVLGIWEDCPGRSSDDKVRDVITEKAISKTPLDASPILIDDVKITLLPLPARHECPDEENNNSLIIRLDFGEFSMLFTGDAEVEQRDWLVDHHGDQLDVAVLKASHHGSHNGTSSEWLGEITPTHVVISAGVNQRYKHPNKSAVDDYVEATGNKLYCTNRHGTVRVYGYRDGRIRVTKQRTNDKSCIFDGTHY